MALRSAERWAIDPWRGEELLRIEGIRKAYGRGEPVLDGVSMTLRPGDLIGLVGPNGAGKTTLLNVLAGVFPPTSGSIWLGGRDVNFDRNPEERRQLGLMLGGRMLIEDLKPGEYFDLMAAMYGMPGGAPEAVGDLIERLRLGSHMSKPIKDLSAGTKKKVEFVAAIMHRPKVLLLDEPFEAIDPPSVQDLTAVVGAYIREAGAAGIISSHILPYVRPLATEIRLLWKGRLYEQDELEQVLRGSDDAELNAWRAVLGE